MSRKSNPQSIIISRTDAIGDVILTLPLAGILKANFPQCKILFFGRKYTQPVVSLSKYVDEFIDYDKFSASTDKKDFLKKFKADAILHIFPRKEIARAAKSAGIKNRVGTSHRLYHLITCNKLLNIGRKNSDLHEAQLNLQILSALNLKTDLSLNEISNYYGFENVKPLTEKFQSLIDAGKINVILHPKSNLSAREWGLENFSQLIALLPKDKFKIFITGSDNEKILLADWIKNLPSHITDLSGTMSLDELISFINACDGLVAASTGPLHIAAALNKYALGIYPPIRPMHAGRWAPVGKHAAYLMLNKNCNDCKNNPQQCVCMKNITAQQVAMELFKWKKSDN